MSRNGWGREARGVRCWTSGDCQDRGKKGRGPTHETKRRRASRGRRDTWDASSYGVTSEPPIYCCVVLHVSPPLLATFLLDSSRDTVPFLTNLSPPSNFSLIPFLIHQVPPIFGHFSPQRPSASPYFTQHAPFFSPIIPRDTPRPFRIPYSSRH